MGGRGRSGRGRLLPHSPAIWVPQSYSTTPTWGLTVVNGYAATTGLAREMARRRVDLPALGKPTLREREPGHSPVWWLVPPPPSPVPHPQWSSSPGPGPVCPPPPPACAPAAAGRWQTQTQHSPSHLQGDPPTSPDGQHCRTPTPSVGWTILPPCPPCATVALLPS